ncbi:endonuclease domain-containing protein [Actinoplanes sp. NPDC023936]|uniref:endonuclease domain-containing protein n=1 Tax=Actinoplanes sp. NPDC023936 TaxID=3154910 RepID=UPI0033D45FF0
MQITAPPRLNNGRVAWWVVGNDGARTLPAHIDCTHRRYRLTCAGYEELIQRSGARCEACKKPAHAEDNGRRQIPGRLQIDHDHELGMWAVRGLLCQRCNSTIDREGVGPRLAPYAAKAFYLLILARHGITNLAPAEPPFGAKVLDFAHRPWRRTPHGWVAEHNQAWHLESVVTWNFLVRNSGPHNLHPIPA